MSCAADESPNDTSVASSDGDLRPLDPAARKAAVRAALRAFPDARVLSFGRDGVPKFVRGSLGRVTVADVPEQTDLRPALAQVAPVLRLRPETLAIRKVSRDARGATHFRLSQTHNGLPVYGAEIIVHVDDGVIEAVNGRAPADLPAKTEPVLDADAARSAAVAAIPELVELSSDETEREPKLAYYLDDEVLRLVFAVEVSGRAESGMPIEDTVLIDAIDGATRRRTPHIHALNRNIHSANHTTILPGALVRTEGSAPVPFDPIVNTNYDRLGTASNCFQSLYQRDSWDGEGALIKSSVHFGSLKNETNGAWWNSTREQFMFGDGDGVEFNALGSYLDVVAHEFTHAVTYAESALGVEGEPGGLNESLSDIFGAVCECWADGLIPSEHMWKIGEGAYLAHDALRYMNDPAKDGLSIDHYDDYYAGIDVHQSSGISNLAFYLLTVGGTHPRGKTTTNVTGIGMFKAAKIFYDANMFYLTASSTFADARVATMAAAEDEYDAKTVTSVSQAWAAVGVFRDDYEETVVPGVGEWGSWYVDAYCPDGTWAYGYMLRVESNQYTGDDTALNSIRLYCSSWQAPGASISSYDGIWGTWGSPVSCAYGSFLQAAKMRVEGKQDGGDDTAANDVRFTCTNGVEIAVSNGGPWGTWGDYTSCPAETAVCGLSIRFESNQVNGDDTAMNGLKLHCCDL